MPLSIINTDKYLDNSEFPNKERSTLKKDHFIILEMYGFVTEFSQTNLIGHLCHLQPISVTAALSHFEVSFNSVRAGSFMAQIVSDIRVDSTDV